MLLEDGLKEYLFDCRLRKLIEKTIKSYRSHCLRLFRYLEDEVGINKIELFNTRCAKQYISFLTSNELKETYINSTIRSLTPFFEYCMNEEYVSKNAMKKIKYQKETITIIETFNNCGA